MWVNSMLLQLLLQVGYVLFEEAVLALDVLGVASRSRATSDAVCRLALGVVLETWRAATGARIASDLSNLYHAMSVSVDGSMEQHHIAW